MFSGYDEAEQIAREDRNAKLRQQELEDTKPRKAVVGHVPLDGDFSQDLLGLKAHRHTENFVQDVDDTKPRRTVLLPGPREAIPVVDLKKPSPKSRFNWASFWTMLASITIVVILVIFVPGPFDEIGAAIALSAINAFIANYRK